MTQEQYEAIYFLVNLSKTELDLEKTLQSLILLGLNKLEIYRALGWYA